MTAYCFGMDALTTKAAQQRTIDKKRSTATKWNDFTADENVTTMKRT